MTKNLRENRKVRRLILEKPLKVIICSIGAQVKYELTTRNISHNGFFLEFANPGRFPFNKSSIVEVWMDLDGENTIFFNGKMARVVYPGDSGERETGPGIAIRIVQIDREGEKLLKDFINYRGGEDYDNRDHAAS